MGLRPGAHSLRRLLSVHRGCGLIWEPLGGDSGQTNGDNRIRQNENYGKENELMEGEECEEGMAARYACPLRFVVPGDRPASVRQFLGVNKD